MSFNICGMIAIIKRCPTPGTTNIANDFNRDVRLLLSHHPHTEAQTYDMAVCFLAKSPIGDQSIALSRSITNFACAFASNKKGRNE